jgi:nitroimidazol reductase NimA-like FMN-containing flavoprotein (pyridoxamine 5'-phosphate oxidase superfamily)
MNGENSLPVSARSRIIGLDHVPSISRQSPARALRLGLTLSAVRDPAQFLGGRQHLRVARLARSTGWFPLTCIKDSECAFGDAAPSSCDLGRLMDELLKPKILDLLDHHRIMTVATNRPDGWPQATTVGYVNDGLTIYFLCSPESQKAANLARDSRISLTIDHDVSNPMTITGLSMAAEAHPVANPAEVAKALKLLGTRYPEYAAFPMPKPEEIAVYRVHPKVISVLDYSKGFGHTDLVTV